jgi:hypothetical protein
MTDKKSRKVLIINNIKSDTIDQAIFILKTGVSKASKAVESSIADEAQGIIDSYIRQVERLKSGYTSKNKKQKKTTAILPWSVLFFLASALCIGLSVILILGGS